MMDDASAPELPADQEARDRFTSETGRNFCVSAGAGAGKTTAIAERITAIAALSRDQPGGPPLRRLVVVTYTNLAAEELRVRARERMLRAFAVGKLPPENAPELLADLRAAYFGTIHAFCLQLAREHARELGLPSRLTTPEASGERAEWEHFCQVGLAGVEARFPRALLRHVRFPEILGEARALRSEQIDAAAAGIDACGECPPCPDFTGALGLENKRAKTLPGEQARLRRFLEEWEDEAPFFELPAPKGGGKEFLEVVDLALEPLETWLKSARRACAGLVAAAWRDHRLGRGLVTYDDQVALAAKVTADPALLDALRRRRSLVLLDEAQDTDSEMFRVLVELARPPGSERNAWPSDPDAAPPEPGRFTFVGDDQQAVYGKRADPAVYRSYVRAYEEERGGERLEFHVTMRCSQAVAAAVNTIFSGASLPVDIVEDECFRRLTPRPGAPVGRIERVLIDMPPASGEGGGADTDEMQFVEMEALANWIVERGPAGLGVRRWSEVAVIAPRIKWINAAGRALARRKVPVRLLSTNAPAGELPGRSWPAALLHVLCEPWDTFELIGVLREIFGVSDVALAQLHQRGGLAFWPLPAEAGDLCPTLHGALTILGDLRTRLDAALGAPTPEPVPAARGTFLLPAFVEEVLSATALEARLEALPPDALGGLSPALALRELRAAAAQAACDGANLREWARGLASALSRETGGLPAEADAIELVSAQKSKGLEWPVVVAVGLGRGIGERRDAYSTDEEEDKESRQARRDAEWRRFLYVTLTRARSRLIIADAPGLYRNSRSSYRELARWTPEKMEEFCAGDGAGEGDATEDSPPPPAAPRPLHLAPAEVRRAAERARQLTPRRVRPSSLAIEKPEAISDAREESAAALLLAEPVGGKDYGTWWHEALVGFPWDAVEARRGEFIATSLEKADPTFRDRAAAELARFIGSTEHGMLSSARRSGATMIAEVPFTRSAGGEAPTSTEGIMDLVVLSADGSLPALILDWKTDRLAAGESPDALLARLRAAYAAQLEEYARVFAPSAVRLALYSTAVGRGIEWIVREESKAGTGLS